MFLQKGSSKSLALKRKWWGAALATPLTRCRANRNALAWASGMYRSARGGRVRKLRAVGDHLARFDARLIRGKILAWNTGAADGKWSRFRVGITRTQ